MIYIQKIFISFTNNLKLNFYDYERRNYYPLRRWSRSRNELGFNECSKDFSCQGLQSNRPPRRLFRTFSAKMQESRTLLSKQLTVISTEAVLISR